MFVPSTTLPHEAQLEAFQGNTGTGINYGAAQTVPCRIDMKVAQTASESRSYTARMIARPEFSEALLVDSVVSWEGIRFTVAAVRHQYWRGTLIGLEADLI